MEQGLVHDDMRSHLQLRKALDDELEILKWFEDYVAKTFSAEAKERFMSDPKSIFYPNWDKETSTPLAVELTREEALEVEWAHEKAEIDASRARKIKRIEEAAIAWQREYDFVSAHVEIAGSDLKYLAERIEGWYSVKKLLLHHRTKCTHDETYKDGLIVVYQLTLKRVMKAADVSKIGTVFIVSKDVINEGYIGLSYITPRALMFA